MGEGGEGEGDDGGGDSPHRQGRALGYGPAAIQGGPRVPPHLEP